MVDPRAIDAVNLVDEGITLATLAPYAIVEPGARRETGYAEIGNNIAVPAYAPEVH